MIAVDSNNAGTTGAAGTSISWTHTCTGTGLMLIVAVSYNGVSTDLSVDYGGVSLTKLAASVGNSGGNTVSLWYLADPATGAHTITVNKGSGVEIAAGSISFTGASPTIGAGASASGSSASASVTITTNGTGNGYIVDCAWSGNPVLSATAGQTQIFNRSNIGGSSRDGASGYLAYASGADKTMSYSLTSDSWAIGAIEIIEGASTTPVISNLLLMGVG